MKIWCIYIYIYRVSTGTTSYGRQVNPENSEAPCVQYDLRGRMITDFG